MGTSTCCAESSDRPERLAKKRAARPGAGRAARRRPAGWWDRPRSGRGSLQSRGVLERVAVTFVGPARALVAHGGMEAHRVQDALDVIGVVSLFEQSERGTARVPSRDSERRFGELRL